MSQLAAAKRQTTTQPKPVPTSPGAEAAQPEVVPEPIAMIAEQDMIETPLRYCVLCRDVAASMTTQEPILYHLIVAIRARQLPTRHPLAVATHWVLDGPAVHQVRVSVRLPESREVLVWSEGEMSVQAPDTHYIHTFQFGELEFPTAGLYRVEVDLDERPAGAFPLLVHQVGQVGADEGDEVAAEQVGQEPGETNEQEQA